MLPALCGPIVVGTAGMGDPVAGLLGESRPRAYRLLDELVDLGLTAFDLAASYMVGGTERLVGGWLAERRHRDRLFLISKGGHPLPIIAPHRLGRAALAADLHASLRRLRTDHLDLYLLHRDDESEPLPRLLETLLAFRAEGLIGAWGVSNWSAPRVQELDALARSLGRESLAASSPQLSLASWSRPPFPGCVSLGGDEQREARALYQRMQWPVLAWSPLASGYFSTPPRQGPAYRAPANPARRERAVTLAAQRGLTPAQVALAYVLSQPFPTHAVVASRSAANMRENLAAAAHRLTPEEVAYLERG